MRNQRFIAGYLSAASIVLIVSVSAAESRIDKPWLRAEAFDLFHVVTAAHATEAEVRAADQFARYWQACTGHGPSRGDSARRGRINVLIGRAASPLLTHNEWDDLPTDGLILRTIERDTTIVHRLPSGRKLRTHPYPDHFLLIAGGGPRGTIYGVYEFFERFMGVRWLTPDVTHIPPPPTKLPSIDVRYEPPFWYRDISYHAFATNPEFAMAHRLNGFWSSIPEGWGNHIDYVRGFAGTGHTFYFFVPRFKYFDEHPEYYSEINGKRVRERTQLCLTNPDVLEITIEKTRELLRNAAPNERIVSISQMDWDRYCTCDTCAALDAHEESHAGSLIHFVNAVAAAIESEFPEAYIDTFAYRYSRKPPKHVEPRNNVIVRITSLECDFSRPLAAKHNERNRAFLRDLAGWTEITKNLFVWDYTQNWYAFQGPHPNVHVLQPNVDLFRDYGLAGVFEQASPFSPGADFEHLKAYILGRSLWNSDSDWRELYDEFLKLYYGPAARFIEQYLALVTKRVKKDDLVMTMFNDIDWMNYDMVVSAQAIFDEAIGSVWDEPYRRRLHRASLPVKYAALVCPPRETFRGDYYVHQRPPGPTFDEYWSLLQEYEVTHLADLPIEHFRNRLNGTTPPRHEDIPITKLRAGDLEAWVLPAKGAAIVRLRDMRANIDYLNGYTSAHEIPGAIRLWRYPDRPIPYGPWPITESFEVVETSVDTITTRQTLPEGIGVEQKMVLDEDELRVDVFLRNDSAEPVTPRIKLHGRFTWSDGDRPTVLWDAGEGEAPVAFAEDSYSNRAESGIAVEDHLQWSAADSPNHRRIAGDVSGEASRVTVIHEPNGERLEIRVAPQERGLEPMEALAFLFRIAPGR